MQTNAKPVQTKAGGGGINGHPPTKRVIPQPNGSSPTEPVPPEMSHEVFWLTAQNVTKRVGGGSPPPQQQQQQQLEISRGG